MRPRARSICDALVYFNPFSFDVQLGGSLTLLRDGDRAAGLGFKLRLRGPNTYKINGKVWVTICGVDVDFSIKHTWGEPQSLPTATASAVDVLRAAIERDARYEPITSRQRVAGVSFARTEGAKQAIDPGGRGALRAARGAARRPAGEDRRGAGGGPRIRSI